MVLGGASPMSWDGGSLEIVLRHRKAASDQLPQFVRRWSLRFASGIAGLAVNSFSALATGCRQLQA